MKKSIVFIAVSTALIAAGWLTFESFGLWLLGAAAITSTAALVAAKH